MEVRRVHRPFDFIIYLYEHCKGWKGLQIIPKDSEEGRHLYDWDYTDGHSPLAGHAGYELTRDNDVYVVAAAEFVRLRPRAGLTLNVSYFLPAAVADVFETGSITVSGYLPGRYVSLRAQSVVVAGGDLLPQHKNALAERGVIGPCVVVPEACVG